MSFRLLGGLRALIDAPFMALTASVPPSIRSEILSSLFLTDPVVVSQDLDRRNIFLSASPIKSVNVCFVQGKAVVLLLPSITERFVWCCGNFENTCCCINS